MIAFDCNFFFLRHRLEEGQASSWTRRLKVFLCCTRTKDSQSDAYSEIAYLFAEFFRDLDIVPSDIIAGLVLLRQRQRAKRNAVLDEVSVRNSDFNQLFLIDKIELIFVY
uniref:Uncharacterized protein n=1 Tax=Micrurus corallinus TaxID=54390 RepID=A0A2D4GDY3_MICCO